MPEWVSLGDLATELRIGAQQLAAFDELNPVRRNGQLMCRRSDVDRWLDSVRLLPGSIPWASVPRHERSG